jgi:uncharacterized UBP type Zn finger protein
MKGEILLRVLTGRSSIDELTEEARQAEIFIQNFSQGYQYQGRGNRARASRESGEAQPQGHYGVTNLLNTCYMGSVLQVRGSE